ncbi:hypothetical protein DFH07DRAFT_1055322 [Mycena maculata]|uniref:Uncharacterized protein n=1 Tax=Mycena maculata TaxID=230809 RepID=A0AAD7NZQ9_9AGAR|nr:hypothetical protein DFH07DRAFT_1055322 [Mycena maculata]
MIGLPLMRHFATTTALAFTLSSALPLYASLKAGAPPAALSKSSLFCSFRTLSTMSVVIAYPPPLRFQPAIAVFNSLTLLLAIPSVLVTTPSRPIPECIRHVTTIPLSKYLTFALTIVLSLVPTRIIPPSSCPASVHITTHFFKRPLSNIMAQMPDAKSARARAPVGRSRHAAATQGARCRGGSFVSVVWEVGVWLLLLPVGADSCGAWAALRDFYYF